MSHRVLVGDVLDRLGDLVDGSVHCVVTSPPYWGLRDYGVEGQIGLEPTIEGHLDRMVAVFEAVRCVLRDDGTCWVNLGDAYASGNRPAYDVTSPNIRNRGAIGLARPTTPAGLKPKDLVGPPWRIAFALQAAGWYLRQDIVWHKPNPMPESVRDRCTKAHEYIFLLTKRPRYFYDAEAIREPVTGNAHSRGDGLNPKALEQAPGSGVKQNADFSAATAGLVSRRNARSAWTIPSEPLPDSHFATFPRALPERCIKAGTSERGCCPACGAPWVRIVERGAARGSWHDHRDDLVLGQRDESNDFKGGGFYRNYVGPRTTGWAASCACAAGEPRPCTVLDPFAGSGTTLLVAEQLGRDSIGIELNPGYAAMAERRIAGALRPGTHRRFDGQPAPLFEASRDDA